MQQTLKTFNQVISVQVSVDSIAAKLLEMMDQTNPHTALVVNTVIGSALSTGKMSFIYNAVNGWSDEVNITIGKNYNIEGKYLSMYNPADGEKERLFTAIVKQIDEYRDGNKVEVEYTYSRKEDDIRRYTETAWVDHNNLVEILSAVEIRVLGSKVESIDGPTIPTEE